MLLNPLSSHGIRTSTMALQCFIIPKQYRVLLEIHITKGQLESPENQNPAQLTVEKKKHCVKLLH